MRVAVSLGGSVFTHALEQDRGRVYGEMLDDLTQMAEQVVVVVGAGNKKQRIEEAETDNQVEKDFLGIDATRENAEQLITFCEENGVDVYEQVPGSIQELQYTLERENPGVVVMGGTEPGHSTDAVAALAAELIDADRFIKATDVDGVYETDPDLDPDAEPYDTLTHQDLLELVCGQDTAAGEYGLLDVAAAHLVARSSIPTIICNGGEAVNILHAAGGNPVGTRISTAP